MIHWCPNCPDDEEHLYLYLNETIESLIILDGEIKFCQWTTIDRANLINCIENVETYTENVTKKVQSITVHSYITKAQSEHLQKLKNELTSSWELMDPWTKNDLLTPFDPLTAHKIDILIKQLLCQFEGLLVI